MCLSLCMGFTNQAAANSPSHPFPTFPFNPKVTKTIPSNKYLEHTTLAPRPPIRRKPINLKRNNHCTHLCQHEHRLLQCKARRLCRRHGLRKWASNLVDNHLSLIRIKHQDRMVRDSHRRARIKTPVSGQDRAARGIQIGDSSLVDLS